MLEHGSDPAVAVTAILLCQGNNGLGQCILICSYGRHITLGGTGLANHSTSPAFRDLKYRLQLDHGLTASFRA